MNRSTHKRLEYWTKHPPPEHFSSRPWDVLFDGFVRKCPTLKSGEPVIVWGLAEAQPFRLPFDGPELRQLLDKYRCNEASLVLMLMRGVVPQMKDNGRSQHPLYRQYRSILRAAARGQLVSLRWVLDFRVFCEDVGRPSETGMKLRRVDKTRPYEKGNVCWV